MKQGECYEFTYGTLGETHARGRFNGIERVKRQDAYKFVNVVNLVTGERIDVVRLTIAEMRNIERVEGPC